MFGVVYKITNKINGKQYIGQTVQSMKRRWWAHKQDSKTKDGYFSRAIRKYGAESFNIEIIAEANNQEELDELESHHISLIPLDLSYNMTAGGEHPVCRDPKSTKGYWRKLLIKLGLGAIDDECWWDEFGDIHKFKTDEYGTVYETSNTFLDTTTSEEHPWNRARLRKPKKKRRRLLKPVESVCTQSYGDVPL